MGTFWHKTYGGGLAEWMSPATPVQLHPQGTFDRVFSPTFVTLLLTHTKTSVAPLHMVVRAVHILPFQERNQWDNNNEYLEHQASESGGDFVYQIKHGAWCLSIVSLPRQNEGNQVTERQAENNPHQDDECGRGAHLSQDGTFHHQGM